MGREATWKAVPYLLCSFIYVRRINSIPPVVPRLYFTEENNQAAHCEILAHSNEINPMASIHASSLFHQRNDLHIPTLMYAVIASSLSAHDNWKFGTILDVYRGISLVVCTCPVLACARSLRIAWHFFSKNYNLATQKCTLPRHIFLDQLYSSITITNL